MTDVVYVTHEVDPADPDSHVDADLDVALAAFSAAGLDWEVAAWDDHGYDWSGARLVLVRSPWDYVLRRREFLGWARDVEALTRLENPASVLETNTDKTYLRELAHRGVATVPTGWIARPDDAEAVVARMRGEHGPRLVVKPTVSASARGTIVTSDAVEAVTQARVVLAQGFGVMVQPYLEAVDAEGETSVLVIDGQVTHAVRRSPALVEGGSGAAHGEVVPVTDEMLQAVDVVLAAADAEKLLYARVDVVRRADGRLALMELELTEPSLFLPLHEPAATVLAEGVAARLG